jgi:TolB protein
VSDRNSNLPTLWLMNAADGSSRRQLATPGLQEDGIDTLSWSPDGSQLAATVFSDPGPTQIALIPFGGTGRQLGHLLTSQAGGALDPAWSPDGNWVAFAGHDGDAVDIFATQPDGSAQTRLTTDALLARAPVWSPDGQHLAYVSNKTGFFEVYEIDVQADTSGMLVASAPRQLTQDLHVDAASGLSWGH